MSLVNMVLSQYTNEPCRICGENITDNELETLVFVGYSECGKSRCAHKACWDDKKNKKNEWAFQKEEKD